MLLLRLQAAYVNISVCLCKVLSTSSILNTSATHVPVRLGPHSFSHSVGTCALTSHFVYNRSQHSAQVSDPPLRVCVPVIEASCEQTGRLRCNRSRGDRWWGKKLKWVTEIRLLRKKRHYAMLSIKRAHCELENRPVEMLGEAVVLSGKSPRDGENSMGIFN